MKEQEDRQRKKEEAQQCAVFFKPPDSPLPDQPIVHSTRIDSGRKTRRRNRELLNKELMMLKQENEKLRKKADRYKKKILPRKVKK